MKNLGTMLVTVILWLCLSPRCPSSEFEPVSEAKHISRAAEHDRPPEPSSTPPSGGRVEISPDQVQQVRSILKRAELGDVESQYAAGLFHASGMGVDQSFKTAAQWFEKAARFGHREAALALGTLYMDGSIPRNNIKAFAWLLLAGIDEMGGVRVRELLERMTEVERKAAVDEYTRLRREIEERNRQPQ